MPLAIDIFCGLGGWTEGLLSEGYDVIGFDIERHQYGEHKYPAQLVLQDVLTLHGSQFRNADLIVASPPCQAYSYRAMPWSRAKALPPPSNELFDACFRIQREACEASGRHIPMVVENVCGAQKWVGRSRWNYGSFHLWGDVPALMPMTAKRGNEKAAIIDVRHPGCKNLHESQRMREDIKNSGGSWFNVANNTTSGKGRNPVEALAADHVKNRDADGYERDHPAAFGWNKPRTNSKSNARKAASAMIAKIPLPLARHIAAYWHPRQAAA